MNLLLTCAFLSHWFPGVRFSGCEWLCKWVGRKKKKQFPRLFSNNSFSFAVDGFFFAATSGTSSPAFVSQLHSVRRHSGIPGTSHGPGIFFSDSPIFFFVLSPSQIFPVEKLQRKRACVPQTPPGSVGGLSSHAHLEPLGKWGARSFFLLPWKNAFFAPNLNFTTANVVCFFTWQILPLSPPLSLPPSLSTPLSYPLRSSYFLSITSYCSWMNKWSVVNDWPPKKPDVDVPSAGSSAGSLVGTTRLVSSGDQAWLTLSAPFIILRK